jgi:hypothetical protein
MWGNEGENLQHRRPHQRHRPAYLAPSAGHTMQIQQQHNYQQYERVNGNYSADYNDKYNHNDDGDGEDDGEHNNDNDNDNNDDYDDYHDIIEDLRIPLLIQIPNDEKLRFPIVSPPSSNGSAVITAIAKMTTREKILSYSPFIIPSLSRPWSSSQSTSLSIQHQQYASSPQNPSLSFKFKQSKLYKMMTSIYYIVLDFLLLIFVCLMGLFFHVEVQVEKQQQQQQHEHNNAISSGRGRIIIQQQQSNSSSNSSNTNEEYHHYHQECDQQEDYDHQEDYYRDSYHSTDLLLRRPPPPPPTSSSIPPPPPRSIDTNTTTATDYSNLRNPYLMLLGDEMV